MKYTEDTKKIQEENIRNGVTSSLKEDWYRGATDDSEWWFPMDTAWIALSASNIETKEDRQPSTRQTH